MSQQKIINTVLIQPDGSTRLARIPLGEKGELPKGIVRMTVSGNQPVYFEEGDLTKVKK